MDRFFLDDHTERGAGRSVPKFFVPVQGRRGQVEMNALPSQTQFLLSATNATRLLRRYVRVAAD